MECILKINDEIIGEKVYEIKNPKTREAVRTILFNHKGEIAILHKKNKNEYKLIGGGIEKDESLEKALKREVIEEAGCEIKNIEKLGYVEELRTINNFMQISYIFISKVENVFDKLKVGQKIN